MCVVPMGVDSLLHFTQHCRAGLSWAAPAELAIAGAQCQIVPSTVLGSHGVCRPYGT
jgi:hypothetical protein